MKRTSVHRMLKKRLSDSNASIIASLEYEDLGNVLGGNNSKEAQHRLNMQNDIEQLKFLLTHLENFKKSQQK